ncbi:23S rRNA (uracil(1939)-C(5))-methyltransferase RlmD [Capnocytophaga catalasegens]|uniref:tRNA (Uracil-5-)-methyltransferase n=1 Tax=Capnocytophaga catalasegens TaxID=1004260 RepID=A0AAV5ARA4_9FLAO|nr:23S rRNA (uracil(1939)-C(5))-methyltransferase RlmD [Capnocytophaga catalasegens]GIZ14071.1 tRNA (uracil-5-)-methyltransferase [Capnocytophaga catalasegens]GJM49069.1 tRNA (uracil-5-)-methyltransferase [Capnocytophaga catalasegens]GJM52330.1 tRNA (uracil-5-)-methyltransferase [Capnocytophaga catalasegens]
MGKKDKKQIFENILVIDAGAKGKSVAKAPDGRVIFLEGVVPDDVVDVQVFKKRKSYYEGTIIAFRQKSTKRTEPVCEHFGYCGGCKWQNMAYEHQLFYKQKEVENNLKRLGGIEIPELLPIVSSAEKYFYRNKMEFSFSDMRWLTPQEIQSEQEISNRNGLGFHIAGAWDKVLDINQCHLQEDPSNAIRLATKEFALRHNLPFYNPRNQTGLLRSMMIRISSTGDIMVVIQFFEENIKKRTQLLDFLIEKFPQITSLQYIINSKANDSIYDQEIICYHGSECIYEQMEGLRFKINAKSFYQTNSAQAYELYKVTRDFADLKGDELVYDLYTGTGTIAQFVAQKVRKVIGVEAVSEAISDAKENAKYNNINNIDFFVGDMKSVFNDEFIQKNGFPDVIITDPPRDGMHKDVVEQILRIAPLKIVYVSCNSATQARDLALLNEKYKVTKVRPVDMFPQTYHVENVVLLEKK